MTSPSRPHRLGRRVIVLLVLMSLPLAVACSNSDDQIDAQPSDAAPGDVDFYYVIDEGVGDKLAAGEPVEVMPSRLDARIGHVLQIDNNDDRGHRIGPFYVGAGETLTQEFSSPGTYIGECTVDPDGEIVINVAE